MKNDTMRICTAQGDERVSGSIRRSADWIRLAMVVHAVVVNLLRLDVAHQPVVMIVVSSVMVAWSLVMVLYGRRNCRRRRNLYLCDIGITAVIVALSGPVLGTAQYHFRAWRILDVDGAGDTGHVHRISRRRWGRSGARCHPIP